MNTSKTMNISTLTKASIAATMLFGATACTSTVTGEEGNLKFSYYSTDSARDFNKPIAIGAKLDIQVEDAGSNENDDVVVNSVESSDDAVIAASKAGGDVITLEAKAKGSADITVDAAVSRTGTNESDYITMRTTTPEKIALTHLCNTGESTGYYLVGQKEVYLGYDMKLSDGQEVIGYGYYPVTADPTDGIIVDTSSKTHDFVRIETGATAGQINLTSDVSEDAWTINLVEESAIDGAVLQGQETVSVGKSNTFRIHPTVQGSPICQPDAAFTIEVTTPDLCDIAELDADSLAIIEGSTRQKGWLKAEGKAVGDCTFNITYTNAMDGAGVTKELSIPVQNAS